MSDVLEDTIGCLCWFWYNEEDYIELTEKEKFLGILEKIDRDHWENYPNNSEPLKRPYFMKRDNQVSVAFPNCRPVRSDEIRLYDDNRYNCCAENEELRLKLAKLEEENKKLRDKFEFTRDIAREIIDKWYDKYVVNYKKSRGAK